MSATKPPAPVVHWRCIQCDTRGVTDGAAERHTKATTHATVTSLRERT